MEGLTVILAENGFRQTASSEATLTLSRGTVRRTRWQRDIDGRTATVEVEQVCGGEEIGTLQPGQRRACAGIRDAEGLEKALAFHHFV